MASHVHIQPTAATTWTINHGLGSAVTATVAATLAPSSIEYPSASQVVVTFASPATGSPGCARGRLSRSPPSRTAGER